MLCPLGNTLYLYYLNAEVERWDESTSESHQSKEIPETNEVREEHHLQVRGGVLLEGLLLDVANHSISTESQRDEQHTWREGGGVGGGEHTHHGMQCGNSMDLKS